MVSNVRLRIGAKVRHPVHGVGRIAWHARYDGRLELAVKFPVDGGGWKTRFLTVDEIAWTRARKTRGGGEISKELLEMAKKARGGR